MRMCNSKKAPTDRPLVGRSPDLVLTCRHIWLGHLFTTRSSSALSVTLQTLLLDLLLLPLDTVLHP